ncbi:hypothetical protein [Streptomyces altiplanensis]
MDEAPGPAVAPVTGAGAAGRSTAAQALTGRLPRAADVRAVAAGGR